MERVTVCTKAFPGKHTQDEIEPWVRKVSLFLYTWYGGNGHVFVQFILELYRYVKRKMHPAAAMLHFICLDQTQLEFNRLLAGLRDNHKLITHCRRWFRRRNVEIFGLMFREWLVLEYIH